MALGNNRDYKTSDRRARKQLEIHKQKMEALMVQGYSRDEASALALKQMQEAAKKK